VLAVTPNHAHSLNVLMCGAATLRLKKDVRIKGHWPMRSSRRRASSNVSLRPTINAESTSRSATGEQNSMSLLRAANRLV